MKTFFTIVLMLICTGCMTAKDPVVETTKPWENHYYTVEQF